MVLRVLVKLRIGPLQEVSLLTFNSISTGFGISYASHQPLVSALYVSFFSFCFSLY